MNEGDGTMVFRVNLSGPAPEDIVLTIRTRAPNPEYANGTDYSRIFEGTTITIPAGSTGIDIPIAVFDDTMVEGTELVGFAFNIVSGPAVLAEGVPTAPNGDATATGRIVDNDVATPPVITFGPQPSGANEGATVTLWFVRDKGFGELTVNIEVEGQPMTVTFEGTNGWASVEYTVPSDGIPDSWTDDPITVTILPGTGYAVPPVATSEFPVIWDADREIWNQTVHENTGIQVIDLNPHGDNIANFGVPNMPEGWMPAGFTLQGDLLVIDTNDIAYDKPFVGEESDDVFYNYFTYDRLHADGTVSYAGLNLNLDLIIG